MNSHMISKLSSEDEKELKYFFAISDVRQPKWISMMISYDVGSTILYAVLVEIKYKNKTVDKTWVYQL